MTRSADRNPKIKAAAKHTLQHHAATPIGAYARSVGADAATCFLRSCAEGLASKRASRLLERILSDGDEELDRLVDAVWSDLDGLEGDALRKLFGARGMDAWGMMAAWAEGRHAALDVEADEAGIETALAKLEEHGYIFARRRASQIGDGRYRVSFMPGQKLVEALSALHRRYGFVPASRLDDAEIEIDDDPAFLEALLDSASQAAGFGASLGGARWSVAEASDGSALLFKAMHDADRPPSGRSIEVPLRLRDAAAKFSRAMASADVMKLFCIGSDASASKSASEMLDRHSAARRSAGSFKRAFEGKEAFVGAIDGVLIGCIDVDGGKPMSDAIRLAKAISKQMRRHAAIEIAVLRSDLKKRTDRFLHAVDGCSEMCMMADAGRILEDDLAEAHDELIDAALRVGNERIPYGVLLDGMLVAVFEQEPPVMLGISKHLDSIEGERGDRIVAGIMAKDRLSLSLGYAMLYGDR